MRSVKDLLGFITTIVVADPRPGVRDRGYGLSVAARPSLRGVGRVDAVGFDKEGNDVVGFRPWELKPPLDPKDPEVVGFTTPVAKGAVEVDFVGEPDWTFCCQRSRTKTFLPVVLPGRLGG